MSLINSLTSGVSALRTFSRTLEVIGDNIANVSTTGFKGSRAHNQDSFSDLLQRSAPSTGTSPNTDAIQVGTGVKIANIRQRFTQGSLTTTGSPSDIAVAGNGFFCVHNNTSGQDFVTRAGDFRVTDTGDLVTNDGLSVQGLFDGSAVFTANVVNGALSYSLTSSTPPATVGNLNVSTTLSSANGNLVDNTGGLFTTAQIDAAAPRVETFSVDKSGNINLFMSNGESFIRGQVLLQNFTDPNALMRAGGNNFSGMSAAGPVGGIVLTSANAPGMGGLGSLQAGALELSNVDLTEEFADLITTQRSFQAGARIITVSDSVLEELVNLKR